MDELDTIKFKFMDLMRAQEELRESRDQLEAQATELSKLASELEAAKQATEQANEELERSSRLFRILADNATDAIALRPLDGSYFYLSPASERMSGYSIEELKQTGDLSSLIHPDDQPLLRERQALIASGQDDNEPLLVRYIRKDGTIRWVQVISRFVPAVDDPDDTNLLTSVHDLTDLILSQEELRKSRDQLETKATELAQLTTELEGAKHSIEENLATVTRDIELASNMQEAILPTEFPDNASYDVGAFVEPVRIVGGDFYEFFELSENRIGFAIADVAGKGVPAAFFMAISHTMLETVVMSMDRPSDVLDYVNQRLCVRNPLYLFVTLFYGILDLRSGTLTYSNGGHNPPYLIRAGESIEELPLTDNTMLGIMPEVSFDDGVIDMNPGDTLFLYTDGITESFAANREMYGDERLQACLGRHQGLSVEPLLEAVRADVSQFVGTADQSDDLTGVCIRFNAYQDTRVTTASGHTVDAVSADAHVRIEITSDVEQLPSVYAQIGDFCRAWNVSEAATHDTRLCLEEYIVNLISYGYEDTTPHQVQIDLVRIADGLYSEVFDDGREFDPLNVEPVDLDVPLADRPIGGLGVHLIRNLMDDLRYERIADRNRFAMTKLG